MNKTAIANINSSMGYRVALRKKDEITRSKAGTRYRIAPILQPGDGSRRPHSTSRLVDVADQSTAIETGVGCVAPVSIWRTDKADGIDGYVIGLLLREGR